ncbi:peptidase M15 [Shewanella psychrotolerans]|uniref:peptidase M15 n=1 Tax=Shewanella psychrotolerans TaxID=2864206 RepID=UPI001C6576E3|nr:peptidase M15 [Shewanella psychrotolerans]QYK02248.1 peptidase M15 [Shewanella psychrotolerans]
MRKPQSVKSLEKLGRVQLSPSFFMRDFLHSEISQIESIPNIPDFPDIAIQTGSNLCQKLLEPLQNKFGRISIRSAYRSPLVNAKGADNKNQYSCASNESNFASHIWDYKDANGYLGATACIIVNSFIPYYERTGNWQALAWWIHDNIPEYSHMQFFPNYAAFNLSWHEVPKKEIYSFITGSKGYLTKPGADNFDGEHSEYYEEMLREIGL